MSNLVRSGVVVCIVVVVILVAARAVWSLVSIPALGVAFCPVWLLLLLVRARRKWGEAPFGWTTEGYWAPTPAGGEMWDECLVHRTAPGKEVSLTKFLSEEVMRPFVFPTVLIVGTMLCAYLS